MPTFLLRRNIKILVVIGLSLTVFGGIVFAKLTQLPSLPEVTITASGLKLSNFERAHIENGKRVWWIKAEAGSYNIAEKKAELEKVQLDLSAQELLLTCDAATAIIDGQELLTVEGRGNVKIHDKKNLTANFDIVRYDHRTGTVESEHPVSIVQGAKMTNMTINSGGVSGDLKSQNFYFFNGVQTIIKDGAEL